MNLHESRLRAMLDPGSLATWDLSPADLDAIRWALDAIESLKAERDEVRREYGEHLHQTIERRDKLRGHLKALGDFI